MRFYYTGASVKDQSQDRIEHSLGGMMSSSVVPNDMFSNVFDDLSQKTVDDNKSQIIALILKNELEDVTNLSFYFKVPENPFCKIEIGVTVPGGDLETGFFLEQISNMNASPYNVTFHEAIDADKLELDLPIFKFGDCLGIWFKRTLLPDAIKSLTDTDTIAENVDNPVKLPTQETFELNIDWDSYTYYSY